MKTKRIAAVSASLGIIASMTAFVPMSVCAAYLDADQATGSLQTFDKYLVLESDAAVPNATSVFTIEPVEPAEGAAVDGAIFFKGVDGAVFKETSSVSVSPDKKTATVSFKTSDETTLDTNVGSKTVEFADNASGNEKFATIPVTVDFTGVKFAEPGIYCYKLTEETPTSAGITNVSGLDYTYYVNVVDNEGKLSVESYTLQKGTAAPVFETLTNNDVNPAVTYQKNTKKVTGVTNRYTSHSLNINKIVKGNQGSRDKYFKFTVKLTNPDEGAAGHINVDPKDIFIIDVHSSYDDVPQANAATTYTDAEMLAANKTEVHSTTGDNSYKYITYSQLSAGKVFYLHSGQNIKLLGIPDDLGYEITEEEEEYTPAVEAATTVGLDSDGTVNEAKDTISDNALTADAEVTFTNTKGGVIPTGVIVSVIGSAGIAAVGAAGVACGLFMKKKKSDEE